MAKFEDLLVDISEIAAAPRRDERDVRWLDARRAIGVAREAHGGLEVFLRCAQLEARSALVRRHMQFDAWAASGAPPIDANRIVLPGEPHFVPVAALIVEELLRNGGGNEDVERAFRLSEPILELALRRTALPEEAVLGLLGELFFLDILLGAAADAAQRAAVLKAWRGFEPAAHDFVFDGVAVEVKTTTLPASTHFTSLRQVDPVDGAGQRLGRLYLLSIGLECARPAGRADEPAPGALTLPGMVESVLRRLGPRSAPGERTESQEVLLRQVAVYGGDPTVGYQHDRMAKWDVYQEAYGHRFQRIYEMNDDAVRVPRHSEFDAAFVALESVRFVVTLPDRVRGDANPTRDVFAVARELLGR